METPKWQIVLAKAFTSSIALGSAILQISEIFIYYKLYKSSGTQLFHIKNRLSIKSYKLRRQKNTINLVGQIIAFLSEIFFTLIGGIMLSLGVLFPGHRSKYFLYHTYIMSYAIGSLAMFLSSHDLRRFYFGTDNIEDLTIVKPLRKITDWLHRKSE